MVACRKSPACAGQAIALIFMVTLTRTGIQYNDNDKNDKKCDLLSEACDFHSVFPAPAWLLKSRNCLTSTTTATTTPTTAPTTTTTGLRATLKHVISLLNCVRTLTPTATLTHPQRPRVSTHQSAMQMRVGSLTRAYRKICLSRNAGLHAERTVNAMVRISARV